MAALGVAPPDIEPHATEHIDDIIAMINELIARNAAYEAEGHVLFESRKTQNMGLARRAREDMLAGARVEIAPYKRDAGDFVLWKPSATICLAGKARGGGGVRAGISNARHDRPSFRADN